MYQPKISPIELERRKREEEEERLFLKDFEHKLNFKPSFIEKKEVDVEFFIKHILPNVIVLEITEDESDIGIYLYIETTDDLRTQGTVTFWGIGFNTENHRWDRLNTFGYFYYHSEFISHPDRSGISDSEVIRIIQSNQQYVSERMRIQDMSLKEIKKTMSEAFITAWIKALETTIEILSEELDRFEPNYWVKPISQQTELDLAEIVKRLEDFYHEYGWLGKYIDPQYKHKNDREDFSKGAGCSSMVLSRRIRKINSFADVVRFISELEKELSYLSNQS